MVHGGFVSGRGSLALPSVAPGSTDFVWSTGIEDTFIGQPDQKTARILDEYALTGHYERWEEDLSLIASLGVRTARYGIPWYRVEAEPGVFDWSWTDQVLETLVLRHGVEPIVDLVHYGTPAWLEGSFLNPSYADHVAAYARAFARRYRGLCSWYTPLNEPRVNAWFAARLGWWPPYGRSWRAYAQVLVALARGIVKTQKVISDEEPNAKFVHVDATDLYRTADPSLDVETALRQELVFLALDLVQGKVDEEHTLREWLRRQKIAAEDVEWFQRNTVTPDIIGYNLYPMFSRKEVLRNSRGTIAVRNRPCGPEVFEALTLKYAQRYNLPVMCTETASTGSSARRSQWIQDTTNVVHRLRAAGVAVVGYTYWPLFSLISWPYRRGTLSLDRYLVHMGLWDLTGGEGVDALQRVETSAASFYRSTVASPVTPMGPRR